MYEMECQKHIKPKISSENYYWDSLKKFRKRGCEDWLLEAVVITLRLSQVCAYENTSSTACAHVAVFAGFKDWKSRLKCETK